MAETFTGFPPGGITFLAVLAADNTKPLTSLAPVVEMTSHFTLTLPVTLAAAISTAVSRALSHGTIYTHQAAAPRHRHRRPARAGLDHERRRAPGHGLPGPHLPGPGGKAQLAADWAGDSCMCTCCPLPGRRAPQEGFLRMGRLGCNGLVDEELRRDCWPGVGRISGSVTGLGAEAYLKDRVRVNAGGSQLYGTQFTAAAGTLRPHPIEYPARLDERRAQAGLEPHADYEARIRANGQRRQHHATAGIAAASVVARSTAGLSASRCCAVSRRAPSAAVVNCRQRALDR